MCIQNSCFAECVKVNAVQVGNGKVSICKYNRGVMVRGATLIRISWLLMTFLGIDLNVSIDIKFSFFCQ